MLMILPRACLTCSAICGNKSENHLDATKRFRQLPVSEASTMLNLATLICMLFAPAQQLLLFLLILFATI